MLIGQPSTSRMNSIMPRYELRHISASATTTWRSHRFVTCILEQYCIVRGGGEESVIQSVTRLVRLLVDKFAAHPGPPPGIVAAAPTHRSISYSD
jgi:hypothetical protein